MTTNHNNWTAVILAAGQGTRMRSSTPKVLHELAGKAMLRYVHHVGSDAAAARPAEAPPRYVVVHTVGHRPVPDVPAASAPFRAAPVRPLRNAADAGALPLRAALDPAKPPDPAKPSASSNHERIRAHAALIRARRAREGVAS